MNTINVQRNQMSQAPQQKKSKWKTIVIILLVVVVGIGLWMWLADNGEWVCEDGQWIAKGNVDTQKPTEICQGDKVVQAQEKIKPEDSMIISDSKKVAEGIDIRVKTPHVNATVNSPLEITGEAKDWYTEKLFYVELVAVDGTVLGHGTAKAVEDVNIDEYIPFEAKIDFKQGESKSADLIFYRKSNSKDMENTGTFSFPIFFE